MLRKEKLEKVFWECDQIIWIIILFSWIHLITNIGIIDKVMQIIFYNVCSKTRIRYNDKL